jgi:DNA polymerase-3 subunit chi
VTEIAFHFNAPDKLSYACRLLRKAYGSSALVVVTGPLDMLKPLDSALWTFGALEFVPHCLTPADAALLAASPVVLACDLDAPGQVLPHHQVLVNLGDEVPLGFERFERMIEVVVQDEQDRLAARRRWKHYADRGYSIQRHDLATREAAEH